jgi:hypothetical protein
MNVHEAILLACVSLIAALGLQGPPVLKLDWTGALPTYPIAAQWPVPLCGGMDIGIACVLLDHPAAD